MVPLSAYVSIEIVRVAQSLFINADNDITYKGQPAQCKNSNLTEELGQIRYLFSDKTGTLTANEMVFKSCSILGKRFRVKKLEEISKNFPDEILHFFVFLGLCNTVLPEYKDQGKIEYTGSSPDEVALVKASANFGIIMKVRHITSYLRVEPNVRNHHFRN
jgi:phospholipid-transporting ATPase